MLREEDKIFKNLYGLKGSGLNLAKELGDWKNTKDIINKGKKWIFNYKELKKIIGIHIGQLLYCSTKIKLI